MTTAETAPQTATWNAQLEQLRARYKHVRPPVLAALSILINDKDISIEDAKAQAKVHGVKITAASVAGAQRLLSRMDGAPSAVTVIDRAPDGFTAVVRPRRSRAADSPVDVEALVRGMVTKLQGQGSAEAERLRDAIRKAIAILTAAAG